MKMNSSQFFSYYLIAIAVFATLFAYLKKFEFQKIDVIIIVLFICGLGSIVAAKYSNIAKGNYFSFGLKSLNKWEKVFYLLGYILLISGAIVEGVRLWNIQ